MSGALIHYITHAEADGFQPMKANMGLLPDLPERIRNKRQRYAAYAEKASQETESYLKRMEFAPVA